MKTTKKSNERFLSIRLTPGELEQVYKCMRSSTCRSLTEYTRKVLTRKPVIVKLRNESVEQLIVLLIEVKQDLADLVARCPAIDTPDLRAALDTIKSLLTKMYNYALGNRTPPEHPKPAAV